MTSIPRRIPGARLLAAAALGILSFAAAGCGGLVRVVDIDSKPQGAVIYINGEKKGTTRDEKVRISYTDLQQRALIQIVKPQYKPVFQYWMYEEVPEKKIFQMERE